MKKLILGILIGFFVSMGLRTSHSVLCNYYWNKCKIENSHKDSYNPVDCMNEKMGNFNILSTIAGFPMLFFNKWEWFG